MSKAIVNGPISSPDAGWEGPAVPELLAPAGNMTALVAAVESGADAVYLGLREFSARRGAANFSLPELAEATRYAHLRGCKVYLAANILVLPNEMGRALRLAADAREAGVDAFIVQDLGLARLIKSRLPDVPLHASTQISTHTADGAAALAGHGFDRVTLARELSVAEIAQVAGGQIPVEVFVHGALCYCYSGQCLLSSMVGGRSGNRGLCVQACRLAYELADERLGAIEAGGEYPLSTKDLAAIDLIPELIRAGVASLKIEGRLKSAGYVATVVDVYRRALDRYALRPKDFAVAREDRQALEEVFSRGFTQGYLVGIRDHRMMSPARPSDRGVPIGRVTACDQTASTCDIKLTRDLGVGDDIEIWVRKGGRVRAKVSELSVAGERLELARTGQVARVRMPRPIGLGDRVFRTASARLLEATRQRLRPAGHVRLVPVDLRAELRAGEPLRLSATAGDGSVASAEGAIVEPAERKPLDRASVAEHISRLGGTPYEPREVTVELSEACHLSFAAIHQARSELLARLDRQRLAPWRRAPIDVEYEPARPSRRKAERPLLCVTADDRAAASAFAGAGVDWLYFDTSFDRDGDALAGALTEVADAVHDAGGRFALQPPAIVHEHELGGLDRLVDALGDRLDAVVVGNLGLARRLSGRARALFGDVALNVTNAETGAVLGELGLERLALSVELTGDEVAAVTSAISAQTEVLAFGALQVMVAEHCLYSGPDSCERCAGRSGSVRDAKGFVFPVRIDCACRTRIYNPFDLSLVRQLPELCRAGVGAVRMSLGGYEQRHAVELVRGWQSVLSLLPEEQEAASDVASRLSEQLSRERRYTTGHYHRAVK